MSDHPKAEKAQPIVLCGPGKSEPDYRGINSPSGRCAEHGDYLYYCPECHELWRQANPEKVAKISRLAKSANPTPPASSQTEGEPS